MLAVNSFNVYNYITKIIIPNGEVVFIVYEKIVFFIKGV